MALRFMWLIDYTAMNRSRLCVTQQTWIRRVVFIRFNLVPEIFGPDSTHDSQWLSKNCFKSSHDSEWLLEFDSYRLMAQMAFQNFDSNWLKTQKVSRILIQINSWLKKLPKFWFKSTHDSKKYWFESTQVSIIPYILMTLWLGLCPTGFDLVDF